MLAYPAQAPAGHAVVAGVDQRHPPWFGALLVDDHVVAAHVERDVGHMQEVVGEILLDDIALIAAADHEVVDAVRGVDLQDVPQDRTAADLDHRLGAQAGFLGKPRAESAGQDDCLHWVYLSSS